jgi:hypothetical protein
MIPVEDIVASAVEAIADTVHDITSGGPGSGRHCEVCNVNTKKNLCPKCNEAVERYGRHRGISNADAIEDMRNQYKRHGESFLRRYATSFQGDLAETLRQSLKAGEATYPDDHKAAMQVPKGGSSCASCKYVSEDKKECSNEYYIKWNDGSKKLPLPADEFCSDWWEPKKELEAATESSPAGDYSGTLWHGIKISGFTGPEEEGLRAMISRVPPELLVYVKQIKSANELNAVHGKYEPETSTIFFNPKNFINRTRLGKGEGWIYHIEITVVHEVFHSIYENFSQEEKKAWQDLSGWIIGWKPGQSLPYVEKRPGWPKATSKWTHKAGIKFTRHYAERNPNEDFADCGAFVLLGKGYQMEPSKKEFIEKYIKDHVHNYPQVSIQSHKPVSMYGGGLGSGRHPYGRKPKDENKIERAKASYVPMTKEKYNISTLSEGLVAKAIGGTQLADHEPFDVMKKGVGIEVKTLFPGMKNTKITMHKSSLARKMKEARQKKLRTYTVVVDMRQKKLDVLVRAGLGSFNLHMMKSVNTFAGLTKYIK